MRTGLNRATIRCAILGILLLPGVLRSEGTSQPLIQRGTLDLSHYDFQTQTPLALNGEWEFHWGRLLAPEDTANEPTFVPLPGAWSGIVQSGRPLPSQGAATYRLKVRFPATANKIKFHLPIVGTSYRFFLNDQMLGSNGVPGLSKETTEPDFKPLLTTTVSVTGDALLTLQVANFHDRSGGPWFPIEIGNESAIQNDREHRVARDLLLCGALLIMGLYHIGLFVVRRREDLPLYFGLFCIVLAFRSVTEGEKYILSVIPEVPWTLAVKFSYVSYYLAIPLFMEYFRRLFPNESYRVVTRALSITLAALSLVVMVTPVSFFSETLPYVHILTLLLGVYCLLVNVRAIVNGRPQARTFLIGLLLLALTVANDILVSYRLMPTAAVLAPLGVFVFIFAQAYLLSDRFSRAFLRSEQLTQDLDRLNNELENRIEERNRELNATLKSIRRDLSTARKIQQAFLPRTDLCEGLSIDFLYIPMEEVGGDIFDFERTSSGQWRCLLADATGHGVQGALVTMALKSEFENLSRRHNSPSALLADLNQNFIAKFGSTDVFATAIVMDFDLSRGEVRYASAGHPDQWAIGAARHVIARTGPALGLRGEATYSDVRLTFSSQETIFLFSDGAFENLDQEDLDFGERRLIEILDATVGKPPSQRLASVRELIENPAHASEQKDDVTVLAISMA